VPARSGGFPRGFGGNILDMLLSPQTLRLDRCIDILLLPPTLFVTSVVERAVM